MTYFAATNQDGVGEAITMRAGVYVDLLSFFSAASGNAQPISPANAERVAEAQHAAMAAAPGGGNRRRRRSTQRPAPKKSVSAGTIVLAVVAVAVLAAGRGDAGPVAAAAPGPGRGGSGAGHAGRRFCAVSVSRRRG